VTAILGISAFYHDSAAALIIDGKLIAAAQEERFTRKKHDSGYPFNAVEFVLKFANLGISDVDYITFYEKPFLKFERLLETYVAFAPKGFKQFSKSMPIWLKEKLFQKNLLLNNLKRHDESVNLEKKLFFSEHHISHAASAFFPSPYENAVVLTADGVGEWATTTVAIGEKEKLEIVKEIHFPHSLGLLYSAFTYYIGFKVNSGEYKLMGLAPYGKPIYYNLIKDKLVDIKEDGSFRLNQDYFNYSTGLTMTNSKFNNLFNNQPRYKEDEKITQFHMDIAASIQKITEEIILKIAISIRSEYKISNLCLAGGVALNCVANGKILKKNIFDNIWIQPAAGDAGGSLGSALSMWHLELKNKRTIYDFDQMKGSFVGPEYSQNEIEKSFEKLGGVFEVMNEDELIEKTAQDLSEGKAVGWFQGRMEFGPRALGCRSILGDPRVADMQKNLNLKIKYRESFRPFAPSILREDLDEWFKLNTDSPYMLLVSEINDNKKIEMSEKDHELFGIDKLNLKRSTVPAVTHVDYSSRIQTVHKSTNEKYYKLIKAFKDKTGCPILVNTSFNVRGEPIVNTVENAFDCFMGTELDSLVIGNCYLKKKDQDSNLKEKYHTKFDKD
tara:strand:+ start:1220 stop:3058 length:1839 start_codon:yes stop_codon:yes gene_type:complete